MGAVYSKCCKNSNKNSIDNNNNSSGQQLHNSNRQQTIEGLNLNEIQISTIQNAFPLAPVNEADNDKILCKISEIHGNQMKEFEIEGEIGKIIVIKQDGKFHAIGSKCTHYGAPLSMGSLGEGRIRCPFHGACFNIKTGDIEDFPGLDSLPCYDLQIKNDDLILKGRKTIPQQLQQKRGKSQTFLIIGGGPSGQTCAETLRANHFEGRIVMICKEEFLPYDRTKISKKLNAKIEEIQLRPLEFYEKKNIEIMLNAEAIDVDFDNKEFILSNGENVKYDKAFIATGSRSRTLKTPGIELKNIFFLRTLNDAQILDKQLIPRSHVVILGSSFIGLEIASYALKKLTQITVISSSTFPLQRTFGDVLGKRVMKMFEEKGVKFIMESGIKNFLSINQEHTLSAIQLNNGEFLKADVCILAIGSKFNTKFLRGSHMEINKDGSINTNEFLETNVRDIYVGGDIASSPIFLANNEQRASIGHYAVAQYHGKIAALNMLGVKTKLKTLPYFSTQLLNQSFAYAGYHDGVSEVKEVIYDEKVDIYLYCDNKKNILAIGAFQPNKIVSDIAEKMNSKVKFTKRDIIQYLDLKNTISEPFISSYLFKKDLDDDVIEKVLCDVSDMHENQMKEFEIEGEKENILVIKQDGKFHAISSKCTHYGAPLSMGSLGEGRIRCPWHGACFNIKTGDIEDFPGLDSLPCYDIKVVDDRKVKVTISRKNLNKKKITKKMAKADPENSEKIIIIGGGPSAQTCAETLRQNGFMGKIMMICKENHLPYDRMKISKYLNSTIEDIQLRPQEFYEENNIETQLGREVIAVNFNHKEIRLDNGNLLSYNKLFIATGMRPLMPNIPGTHLKNIFTLRTIDDALKINSMLNEKAHVIILGSSFLAMETAAYCVDKVAKLTVISRTSIPLEETFGDLIGYRISQLYTSKNVHFIMKNDIKKFLGNNDKIECIELENGDIIWADVCIIGIGSTFNTDFLTGTDIKLNKRGSIDTNEYLETNIEDVYAGGDVSNSPVFVNENKRASIGHYAVAQHHGKIAALNMIKKRSEELRTVPYFSTQLFDQIISYTGHGKASEVFVDGDLEDFNFVAFYFDEEQTVVGMSACQPDRGISDFAEKLSQGFKYHRDDIEWAIESTDEEEESDDAKSVVV